MSTVVNLKNLRELTDGDVDTEKELFLMFQESANECLELLQTSITSQDSDLWHKQAHALKGISYGLGAQVLGELSEIAQNDSNIPLDLKREQLAKISLAYKDVVEFLKEVHKNS